MAVAEVNLHRLIAARFNIAANALPSVNTAAFRAKLTSCRAIGAIEVLSDAGIYAHRHTRELTPPRARQKSMTIQSGRPAPDLADPASVPARGMVWIPGCKPRFTRGLKPPPTWTVGWTLAQKRVFCPAMGFICRSRLAWIPVSTLACVAGTVDIPSPSFVSEAPETG